MQLKVTYTNKNTQHRVHPYAFDRRAGAVNERVLCHNFTTGYDETWSTRLFLAEHEREAPLRLAGPFIGDANGRNS